MQFKTENPLDADLDALVALALDPETLREVPRYMPLVTSCVRVEQRALDGGRVRVVDRYEPAIEPPPFARGLTREMLGWDLCLTWDVAARAAEFVIDPHVKPEWKRYADVRGVYRFESRGGRAWRVIEGSLVIRVPLVGAVGERFAVSQLKQQFDGEARLLDACMRQRRGVGGHGQNTQS